MALVGLQVAAGPDRRGGGGAVGLPDVEGPLVHRTFPKSLPHVVLVLVDVRREPVGLARGVALRREEGHVHAGDQRPGVVGVERAEAAVDARAPADLPREAALHEAIPEDEARRLRQPGCGGSGEGPGALLPEAPDASLPAALRRAPSSSRASKSSVKSLSRCWTSSGDATPVTTAHPCVCIVPKSLDSTSSRLTVIAWSSSGDISGAEYSRASSGFQ
eukprot:CAMPEP_0175759632 /NCGR_PEP_ID=MMETSP0097-20121207/65669_1 /TAXON_ID=311494 /ORGANISM="Alexandrium monilatum, Strain CCMP3105" /LENGTH=217 /DNA_ID=CAMNT_0017069031 /DNA_START=97 /DNA_END=752 /DNA_ORIENTATION=+